MDAVVGLLNEISTSVKIGWVMWFVWGTVQIVWYERTRTPTPTPVKSVRKHRQSSASSRKSAGSRRVADVASTASLGMGGSPEFLAGLGLLEPRRAASSEYGVAMSPVEQLERSRG